MVSSFGKPVRQNGEPVLNTHLISHVNPLTYEVDILRTLMLTKGASDYGLPLDFAILVAATAVLVAIAARMYRRMGY